MDCDSFNFIFKGKNVFQDVNTLTSFSDFYDLDENQEFFWNMNPKDFSRFLIGIAKCLFSVKLV